MFKIVIFPLLIFIALPLFGQTNRAKSTVTAAMGDVGGKIFGHAPNPARTKHYYIAAETSVWDYAPAGADVICGLPMPPAVVTRRASTKVRYVQYTDATFTKRVREDPGLGILGPVLRGVVGDYIEVTFLNRADTPWVREALPFSIHPHGVKYDKDNEGAYYQPSPGRGAAIAPGAKFSYVWQLDESSGPLPTEPSSKAWLYHSHANGDSDVNLGLIGFIIVTDPKRARRDGTPADVDRELTSLFMIFNESAVDEEVLEKQTIQAAAGINVTPSWAQVQQQNEEGERYAINGKIFGNLNDLEMNVGERVRWYLFALGSETDFHTAHWHGLRVVESGHHTDVVELLPASMKVADMVADNPGKWLFHCHVAEHMKEGMFANVTVHSREDIHRAPKTRFFGMPKADEPLQISFAEAVVSSRNCEITLKGTVEIPAAFPLFENAVRVRVGAQSVVFHPGRDGLASSAEGLFRGENASKNSSEMGIVYGGELQFSIKLAGENWRRELRAAGLKDGASPGQDLSVPLTVEIAGIGRKSQVELRVVPVAN